jgi:Ca2+-binding EF-hand superfamily protein
MKLTNKTVGLGIAAVAVALLGTAAIADNMGHRGMGMGGPMMGMGGPMMGAPVLDFDAIDANKDGKITPEEIAAWRAAQAKAVDTNGDGKLSVDEIAAMRLKQMTDAAQKMAQTMVDRLDTDGDKMLSAAELVEPPMPPDLFARIDTNKDGVIDKAEADAAQKMMAAGPKGDRGDKGDRGGKHQHPPKPKPGDEPAPDAEGDSGN